MNNELQTALHAAYAAGEILRDGFGRAHDIQHKSEIDVVTETDRASEARIVEILRAATPAFGLFAEEEHRIESNHEARWIIDPLDGTSNFVRGHPHFCVSIALERAGELDLGVVYDPLRDELFAAQRDSSATLNGKNICVGSTASLARALLTTGFPYDAWTTEQNNIAELRYFVQHSFSLRSSGSAALDLAYVACGRLDGYWERGLQLYDMAAGIVLVRAAGGKATNYHGEEALIEGGEMVAANSVLHEEMLAYLMTR